MENDEQKAAQPNKFPPTFPTKPPAKPGAGDGNAGHGGANAGHGISPLAGGGRGGGGTSTTVIKSMTLHERHTDTVRHLRAIAKDIDDFASWLDQNTADFIREIRDRLGPL